MKSHDINHKDTEETDIDDVIGRSLAGQADEDDEMALREWKSETPANETEYEQLEGWWNADLKCTQSTEEERKRVWDRINFKGGRALHVSMSRMHIFLVAACSVLLLVVGTYWFTMRSHTDVETLHYVAGATRTTVHLPDGSTVVLQPGSEIAYNGDFSSHRAVSLKGEGFFSVYHDAAHPFDVSTGKVNVTVLGTQFNINECIPSCITVTLVEGSIKCGTPKGSVKMKPGEQLSVTPSMQKLTVVDTDTVTAWKDGLLRFKSQPLEKIISELQIKHRVTIQLQTSETLRRTKLTASFSDKQNIGDILNVLSHSLPIRCQRVNENTYIIR